MKNFIFCIFSLLISCNDDDSGITNVRVTEAATILGGPYFFIAGDGEVDVIDDVIIVDEGTGSNSTFIVTDSEGNFLNIALTATDLPDFDDAGVGVCLVWYLNYEEDSKTFFDGVENISDLSGDYKLSNSLSVNRSAFISSKL